jgi:hypothetical protein
MERFHLKGIGSNVQLQDLHQFCSKIGKVEELHYPETLTGTGLCKDFAIARVYLNDKSQQIIKQLNGSVWKGSKIRINKAKEHYRDRIKREKVASATAAPSSSSSSSSSLSSSRKLSVKTQTLPIKENVDPFLNIRRARGLPIIRTTAKPVIVFADKAYRFAKENAKYQAKNKKILFEVDANLPILKEYREDNFVVTKPSVVLPIEKEKISSSKRSVNTEKPVAEVKKVVGTGVRKGFGAINEPDCCIDTDADIRRLEEVDGGGSPLGNGELVGVITEAELVSEKDRSMNILQQLLGSTAAIKSRADTAIEDKVDIVHDDREQQPTNAGEGAEHDNSETSKFSFSFGTDDGGDDNNKTHDSHHDRPSNASVNIQELTSIFKKNVSCGLSVCFRDLFC